MSVRSKQQIKILDAVFSPCTATVPEKMAPYDSIYFDGSTSEVARLACGGTIDLVKSVAEGKLQNGMAIVRPSRHNALPDGFSESCNINNVAVAVKQVLETTRSVKKIIIVDFDLCHGQGTQQTFYEDPRVLYFSTHRYEHGNYWPHLEESNYNWIGAGNGIGFNCNIPLNQIDMGDTEFLTVWHQILIPMAYKFKPDLVIVSAGYDAVLGCSEGRMNVYPQCYQHLIRPLMGLANGKLAVILQGRNCLENLAEGAALTLRTLLGDPCLLIPSISTPLKEITKTILDSQAILQKYWLLGTSRLMKKKNFMPEFFKGNAHSPTSPRFDWKPPKPGSYLTPKCNPVHCFNFSKEWKVIHRLRVDGKHRVGLIYDEVMKKHYHRHDTSYPERPERAIKIFEHHLNSGLVERCHRIESRRATRAELRLLHTEEYIAEMRKTATLNEDELDTLENHATSVYFNESTYECALHAAGSVIKAVDSVISRECQAVVAIIRPPGHHAENKTACGFCIFNNVALGAKYAIEKYKLKKVLIIDWDIHHGNGIQHMFEDDPRVLYISLHRYDQGDFFPSKPDANFDSVGLGAGEGFNVNIPWNNHKMSDTEYLAAFTNIILPIAYEYGPHLILVSAGFDAAKDDPLGDYKVTPEGYGHMTNLLMPLANGRIILALEGGYDLKSTSRSMAMCTKVLLGDSIPPITMKKAIAPSALDSIRNVVATHSKYWTVLAPFQKHLPLVCDIPCGVYPPKETVQSNVNVPTVMSTSSSASSSVFLVNFTPNEQEKSPEPTENSFNITVNVPRADLENHAGPAATAPKKPDNPIEIDQENRPEIVVEKEVILVESDSEELTTPDHSDQDACPQPLASDSEELTTPDHSDPDVCVQPLVSASKNDDSEELTTPEHSDPDVCVQPLAADSNNFDSVASPISPAPSAELVNSNHETSSEPVVEFESDQLLNPRHVEIPDTVLPTAISSPDQPEPNENTVPILQLPTTSTVIFRVSSGIFNFVNIEEYSVASGSVASTRIKHGKQRPLRYYCNLSSCAGKERKYCPTIQDLICHHYDQFHNAEKPRRCLGCDKFFHQENLLDEHFKDCQLSLLCKKLRNLRIIEAGQLFYR